MEVRISADDRCEGGLKIGDTIEILRRLEGRADLINVSASHHNKPEVWEWGPTPHVLHEHGVNLARFPSTSAAPTMVASSMLPGI